MLDSVIEKLQGAAIFTKSKYFLLVTQKGQHGSSGLKEYLRLRKKRTEKPQAVANFPVPSSRKAIQRYLGLTSYFRKFVEGYAVISKPLSDLLKKNVELEFREL